MKEVNYTKVYRLVNAVYDMGFKGSGRLALLLSKMLIPHSKENNVTQTIYGFKLLIAPQNDHFLESSVYYTGTYEKGTLHVIRKFLKQGDCFVDAGANIGLMSVYAAKLVGTTGKVFAFEANPATKEILDYNISVNGLNNIVTSSQALGSDFSKGVLHIKDKNRGAASLVDSEDKTAKHEVEIIRLDGFTSLPKVDMLKIDVEGYELEVLRGFDTQLQKDTAPALIVECSNERANYQSGRNDLFDFIKSQNDYRIYKLKKGKRAVSKLIEIKAKDDLPQHDNLFCFLPIHLNRLNGLIE